MGIGSLAVWVQPLGLSRKEEPDLEASPTQRARMRAGCSLAFLVFYYFWTARYSAG